MWSDNVKRLSTVTQRIDTADENETVDLIKSFLVRVWSVRVWCSSLVFEFGVRVWGSSMVFEFGVRVWGSSLEFEYGVRVWGSSLEFEYGVRVWQLELLTRTRTTNSNSTVKLDTRYLVTLVY